MVDRNEELKEAVALYRAHGCSKKATAVAMGVSRTTIQKKITQAAAAGLLEPWEHITQGKQSLEAPRAKDFEAPELPSGEMETEELIAIRLKTWERKNEAERARKLIPINIKLDGPIGIVHFGDPHVDDDGCNFRQLVDDVQTVKSTPGMMAGNVGDLQNNWVGRLAALFANQSATAAQSWQLTEWLVKEVPWLYLIKGNHDMWSGSGDPLNWMMQGASGVMDEWQMRLALKFKNGREVRINARHDFSGHSQWNSAHGPAKAAMMGFRDHILVAGHRHVSGYNILKDPATGLISHAIRVSGYKEHDHYAKVKGFPDGNFAASAVTIIDPYEECKFCPVTTFFDVQEAAEYLTWKRGKNGY